jgi:hypothetical protein
MQARRRLEATGDRSTQVYGTKRRGWLRTEFVQRVGTRVVKTLRVLILKPHYPNTRFLKCLVFRTHAARGEILEYFTSEPRRSNAGLEEPKRELFSQAIVRDHNQTQAAINAGVSDKLAESDAAWAIAPNGRRRNGYTLHQGNHIDWMDTQPAQCVHAIVTGRRMASGNTPQKKTKLRNGRGGIWRIPPYHGCERSPVPRFTV